MRFFLAGAASVEVDKQGRILLPANLREYAGIDKEVVSVGVFSRVEIWSKERYLEKVFKMIADKKTGKRIRLPKNADNDMAALYALLESNYGSSIMRFSLDSCLSKISAAVFPIYDSDNQQLLDVDYLNLCLCGNKYQVRYSYPICYSGETLVKEITKSISELLTK